MTRAKDTDFIGDAGVALVRLRVGNKLRWIFREKPTLDYGIDGEVEVVDTGEPAGRFVLLQIKTGSSYLKEADEDGWTYRPDNAHVAYWRRNVLPVCIVLVDLDAEQAYWQVVDDDTLRSTGKGWAVHVPRAQTIATAGATWAELAALSDRRADLEYPHNLQVLPPSAAAALELARPGRPTATARLAQRLAAARADPAEVCQSLLRDPPSWLNTATAWHAVASYAAEHELPGAASDALLRSAALDQDAHGRLTAAAGLHRLAEPAAARALLEQAASSAGGALLAEIGLHLLDQPTGPLPDLQSAPTGDSETAVAAAYRREQATRADDLNTAISHAEQACQLAPTNTSYQLELATLLTRRSGRVGAGRDDLAAAERLARAVLEDRRAWNGSMVEPTVLALKCALLADRVAEALALGTASPNGTADSTVAADPEVTRLTARAWTRVGRPDRARELATTMPDGLARARVLADLPPQSSDPAAADAQQVDAWQDVLNGALEAADHETVMAAAARLAHLGRSSDAPLAALVADGRISADTARLVEAVAVARRDPKGGMPALRELALHDVTAAETAVITLAETGQYEQAAELAAQAYGRLRAPTLLPLRMDVLADGHLREQAVQAAHDALADDRVQGPLRANCYRLLARDAGEDGRWPQAETLLEQALAAGAGRHADADAWSLIRCQLNQRAEDRALRTLHERAPQARGADDAHTWLRVHATHPWTDDDVRAAVVMAQRFAEDAQLSAALLGAAVTASDGRLRDEVVTEMQQHVARHGDAGGIKAMGGSVEQFRANLTDLLRRQAALPAQLAPQVSDGELPFGLLASSLHRSYSLLLAEPAAVLCAGAVEEEVYDEELAAARAAVGGRVVVCLDALHVSCLLDLATTLLSRFAHVALTNRARDDALQGVVDARALGGASGQLAWSDLHGTVVRVSRDDHDVQLLRRRVAAIDVAAGQCSLEQTPSTSIVPTLRPEQDGAWISGLDLAQTTGRPLWCDDRVVRALARQVGVPTFGTLALLEALVPTVMDEEVVLARLLAFHIGDLPVPIDVLLEQARVDGWEPGAAATALARPSWWAWGADPAGPLLAILEACREQAPAAIPAWRASAMRGLGRLLRGDPEAASRLLCNLASLGLTLVDEESEGALRESVAEQLAQGARDARLVAVALGLPDPARYLPEMIESFAADLNLPGAAGLLASVQSLASTPEQARSSSDSKERTEDRGDTDGDY